jgi:WhiB family redox-sensing transcriptional regulator
MNPHRRTGAFTQTGPKAPRPQQTRTTPRATATAGGHDTKEVTPMQLSALLDLNAAADETGADIPCRVNEPELWFAESPSDVEFAKSLCGSCPARAECLAGALQRQEPWGVWGGELLVQGAVVARKRPRGRPRKHPVAA